MTLHGLRGQQYQLVQKPFSSGGEGDVFRIAGVNDKVVKIYYQGHASGVLEEKIKLMVQKPLSSNILNHRRVHSPMLCIVTSFIKAKRVI